MSHLVFVVTDPLTADRLLEGQLSFLRARGHDVTVIAGPGPLLERVAARERVSVVGVPMRRAPAPPDDLVSLARLARELRRLRPDLVVASTPKAGLLGTLAARAAGVPSVVYHVRGLRFETTRGALRWATVAFEHVACAAATSVLVNGESLRRRCAALAFAPAEKLWVAGEGSSNGVDVEGFAASDDARERARARRRALGIPEGVTVVGFVGRLVRDKGVVDLLEAVPEGCGLHLLVAGAPDGTDPLPADTLRALRARRDVTLLGFLDDPREAYALLDVLAFPSYREGFPNAPLEAAASGVPTVGYAVTGTVDAVVHGQTGLLVPARDTQALGHALQELARDPALRARLGAAAAARAARSFRREVVWERLARGFEALIAGRRP